MKKNVLVAAAAIASVISVASIGAAVANNHTANTDAAETQAMMGAKLTASEAAKAAADSIGGKVVDVTLEDASGLLVYEVTLIAADGTEIEATVDAMSGAVAKVAATEDNNNGEQSGDQEENGDTGGNGEAGENGENGEGAEG